jgi:DNA-binding NarL/FixJ family response regulator
MAGPALLAIGADRAWRARMQRVFALRSEIRWLGAYASGEARRCAAQPVTLLLLDGDDPLANRARRRPNLPPPRRLCFYRSADLAALERCVAAGAFGYLDKQVEVDALLRAVAAAASGLFVAAPRLVADLLQLMHAGPPACADGAPAPARALTGRQQEVVARVASGLSNKQIARVLAISPETVKAHLHAAFEREGVHGRTALLAALARQRDPA